jgi:hypothetical protein
MMKMTVLGVLLVATGCASVRTEIVVKAPPAEVWAVLTDGSAYPKWNPVLIEAKGTIEKGNTVKYQCRQPSGKQYPIEAEVDVTQANAHLQQSGGTWGLLTFEHNWHLEAHPEGTRVVQVENYGGIGVWFWDRDWVEPAYARVNRALKAEVEGKAK